MREQADALAALDVQVFAVSFESPARIAAFQRDNPLPFPLLRDPRRRAYALFGLERRPATTIWGPQTLLYYGRNLLQGRLPPPSEGSDQYQLGGDVVLRPDRSGGWVFRSNHPADRPAVAAVLALARRARIS